MRVKGAPITGGRHRVELRGENLSSEGIIRQEIKGPKR
jgi:hypothetical protein